MTAEPFDYSSLLRPDLPPAAAPWSGFPPFHFVGGNNDPDSVPVQGLIDAAARALARDGRSLAAYGVNCGSLGYLPLREFVAAKVRRDSGIRCTADEVLITSGSLQGLDLVNQVLLSQGDTVIVERVTYSGTLSRLRRLGVTYTGVDVDSEGMRTDELERVLGDMRGRGIRPKFIYTIPTVQNPSATIMSPARRAELLRLSREYGVPVFEDDCYADLVWDGRRPPALRAMDDTDRVIHIGSFSKSIAPGLRVGYLIAGWPIMSRILGVKGDGGSGALEQMALAEYCARHFDDHVRDLRRALKHKLDVLVAALRECFGAAVQFDDPTGGIFLWVTFPPGVDTTRLERAALQAGVAVNPGAEWCTDDAFGRSRIRICFASASDDVLRNGIATLADVCAREFGVPARAAAA
jgi:2-aminoadipate transaminase